MALPPILICLLLCSPYILQHLTAESNFLVSNVGQKESHQPKVVKSRFGAWYLDPKTWKKQNVGEPLMDAKEAGNGVHSFMTPPIKKLDQLPNPTHFNGHMKAKACTKQAVRTEEPKGQITLFCNSVDLCWPEVQSYQEVCKL